MDYVLKDKTTFEKLALGAEFIFDGVSDYLCQKINNTDYLWESRSGFPVGKIVSAASPEAEVYTVSRPVPKSNATPAWTSWELLVLSRAVRHYQQLYKDHGEVANWKLDALVAKIDNIPGDDD